MQRARLESDIPGDHNELVKEQLDLCRDELIFHEFVSNLIVSTVKIVQPT